MHVHARMHTHTHTHACTRTHAHTHTYAHTRMRACTHTHAHTRTHACTHICTQTYTDYSWFHCRLVTLSMFTFQEKTFHQVDTIFLLTVFIVSSIVTLLIKMSFYCLTLQLALILKTHHKRTLVFLYFTLLFPQVTQLCIVYNLFF